VPAGRDPSAQRHAITVDELLRMTSGLPFDEYRGGWDAASRMWFLERDMAAFAESAALAAAPGSMWNYSDGGYAILARIIRNSTGGHAEDVLRFADRELFGPLGMRHVTLECDATGTPVGSRSMLATPRDWARFGLLYLNEGVVDGRRILPEGWVRYSSSQTLDSGYGAGFWTNLASGEIRQWEITWGMPHAPRDAFFARGYLGQYVVVVPSERIVVARFGVTHRRGADVEGVGRLVADVIAAIGP
jgi:CubicO group peptidase (beta-lactamase class C family)